MKIPKEGLMMRYSRVLFFILYSGVCAFVDAADPPTIPAGETTTNDKKLGQVEAEQLVAAGKVAMQESNKDPSRAVAAAVSFSKAIVFYETAGDVDKLCDLEANIFWCKKRMNLSDVKSFVAQKGSDQSIQVALAKAEAVATKEIPKSEAKNYFDRAEQYAKDHPEDYEQISIHYFEVAERFVGTDISVTAQKLSLQSQQKQIKEIKAAKEIERKTLFSKSTTAAAAAGRLAPIPDGAALRSAVAEVRKLYKENYAKTKPAQKRRLAIKLLNEVSVTKDDPITQYALLVESMEMSIAAADWYTTFTACEVMAQNFIGIDPQAKKKEVFARVHSNTTVQAILKLIDNPDDADANSVVGKYFCFEAGSWDIGLPLLAHGSDVELKAAAEMETLKPATPSEQLELGDKWYVLGKKAKQPTQENLLARSLSWYIQAEPGLTGITSARIAQRIDEIYRQVPEVNIDYAHITVKQWDRLLCKAIEVSASNPLNDIGLTLTKGMKVRIVPHPTETWTMHYENWHWQGGLTNVFDTDAAGLIPKEGVNRILNNGSLGILGVMMVRIGGGDPLHIGEVEGEGKVLIGPNLPGGGSGVGKIHIKVVVLSED